MTREPPAFARLEIRLAHRNLSVVATALRRLARELDEIERTAPGEHSAFVLSHERIRSMSQTLRT